MLGVIRVILGGMNTPTQQESADLLTLIVGFKAWLTGQNLVVVEEGTKGPNVTWVRVGGGEEDRKFTLDVQLVNPDAFVVKTGDSGRYIGSRARVTSVSTEVHHCPTKRYLIDDRCTSPIHKAM